MAYYVSQFVGDGSELNPFRPPADGPFRIIDLRGDSTVQAGRCLLWTPADLPTDSRLEKVADSTVESIPRNISRRIENALGVSLDQFDTLQAIIAELLILHGSFTDPGRWNPLRANRFGRHVIHLGGKVYDAPAPVGATITDDFNRADQAGLGSSSEGWSWTVTYQSMSIVSNQANDDQGGALARAESDLDTDNHYTQGNFTGTVGTTTGGGPRVRVFNGAAETDYRFFARKGGDWFLDKKVSGSTSRLATGAVTWVNGALIRLEVDGSNLEAFYDGVSIVTDTDTEITGNTRTGIITTAGGVDRVQVDNFEAGDLVNPLYQSVDDDPASPTDSDWVNNGVAL